MRKKYVRVDNNEFTLTYKEITSYGNRKNKKGEWVKGIISQPQATRGIDELLAKGFIRIAEYGGAFEKHKSKYSLVDDWKKWKWSDSPIRTRKKDRKRGFQDREKQNTAYASVAHPHIRRRCTPPKETHTPTLHTPQSEKISANDSGVVACAK